MQHDVHDYESNTYSWAYWDNAIAPDKCDELVDMFEKNEVARATTLGESDARVSNVAFYKAAEYPNTIGPIDQYIHTLNNRFYGFDLVGYDEFQYTTYDSSEQGKYDWHMDMALGQNPFRLTRKLSAVILLNDGFEGGEFQIHTGDHEEPETVPLTKGKLIVFPSFIIHRVLPITKGVRRSLVIWVEGRKFR